MMWYRFCLLAGLCSGSSSSGLEGMVLSKLLPVVALPFLCAGESGVGRSAMAEVLGRLAADGPGVTATQIHHSRHLTRSVLLLLRQPWQRYWLMVEVEQQQKSGLGGAGVGCAKKAAVEGN
ncbi:hypothetical protein V6N13_040199 [Hibiscus sabdariffa]